MSSDKPQTQPTVDLAEARRLAQCNVGPLAGAMMERMADEIERLRDEVARLKHALITARERSIKHG